MSDDFTSIVDELTNWAPPTPLSAADTLITSEWPSSQVTKRRRGRPAKHGELSDYRYTSNGLELLEQEEEQPLKQVTAPVPSKKLKLVMQSGDSAAAFEQMVIGSTFFGGVQQAILRLFHGNTTSYYIGFVWLQGDKPQFPQCNQKGFRLTKAAFEKLKAVLESDELRNLVVKCYEDKQFGKMIQLYDKFHLSFFQPEGFDTPLIDIREFYYAKDAAKGEEQATKKPVADGKKQQLKATGNGCCMSRSKFDALCVAIRSM